MENEASLNPVVASEPDAKARGSTAPGPSAKVLGGVAVALLLAGGLLLLAAARPGSRTGRQTPATATGVVEAYHRALSRHDFEHAWGLQSRARRRRSDRDTWADGFRQTRVSRPVGLRLVTSRPSEAVVECRVHYEDVDGSSGDVAHTYDLAFEDGGWKIDRINGR